MNSTQEFATVCNIPWILNAENNRSLILATLCFQCILTTLTISLNSVEFYIIWKVTDCVGTKKAILLNMCLTDVLQGLTTQLANIVFLALQYHGRTICALALFVNITCYLLTNVSILALLLASAERYLAIVHPFVDQRYQQSHLWAVLVAIIWLLALCCTALYHFGHFPRLFLGTTIMTSCSCIVFLYVRIFQQVIRARKEIHQQSAGVGNAHQGRRRPSANMVAILVALSVICYAPFSLAIYVNPFEKKSRSDGLANLLWCLLTVNTVLNPICYCMLNKTLRRKGARLFNITWINRR